MLRSRKARRRTSDRAAEDLTFFTREVVSLLSCSGTMYDHDMPFCPLPFFVLDRVALSSPMAYGFPPSRNVCNLRTYLVSNGETGLRISL